jgi:hypothetical protein
MRALAHLRSEVKDFFDFAIDPILLVRKQEGLEKEPTSCNYVCQLLYSRLTSTYHGITYVDWWGFKTDSKV